MGIHHANEDEESGTSRIMGVLHAKSSRKKNLGGLSTVNVIIGGISFESLDGQFSMKVFCVKLNGYFFR